MIRLITICRVRIYSFLTKSTPLSFRNRRLYATQSMGSQRMNEDKGRNIFIGENVRDALADHFESLYSYSEPLEKVYVLISLAQLLLFLTEASNFVIDPVHYDSPQSITFLILNYCKYCIIAHSELL